MNEFFLNHHPFIRNHKSGFTLIELLVVIAIISVLATLLMTNFVGIRQRGRDGARKSDLRQIQAALEQYRADNDSYPPNSSSLYSVACPNSGPFSYGGTTYMSKVPCDPLSRDEYTYEALPAGCSGVNCINYSIYACLENSNDPEKDTSAQSGCTSTTNVSFTVLTP
jgi:type II secretion system protein G